MKRTKTECLRRIRFHSDRAAGGRLLPTCWTGDGRKISLKDLGDDEWDELALFKWTKGELNPRVFRDERTAWGLRDCLKKMGHIDRDVLKFAVERIMKKRAQRKMEGKERMRMRMRMRKREQEGWKHSRGRASFL